MGEQASEVLSWIEAAGNPWPALSAATLLIAAAWSVGRLMTRGLQKLEYGSPFFDIAAGLTLLGWLAAMLGPTRQVVVGNRSIWMLLGLAVIGLLLGILRRRVPHPVSSRLAVSGNAGSLASRVWTAVAIFLPLLFTLGPTLVLPDGWDELVYHVELPRRWLESGFPQIDLDLPYSAFPSLPELLFWLVAPLDLCLAPRLINWTAWAVALGLFHGVCRQFSAAWPAAAITLAFFLSPAVLMVSANCYVEAFLLMGLAALLSITTGSGGATERPSLRRSLIVGLLCGGIASMKLTGLVAIAFPLLEGCLAGKSQRGRLQDAFSATLIAVVVCLPFYLRPLLATGNPFYPYFDAWFSSAPDRQQMSEYHHAVASQFGLHTTVGYLTGPILLSFDDPLYDGHFGWQLLLLLALAAVGFSRALNEEKRELTGTLAMCGAALYTAWFFSAQQARFACPAALVVALLAARGFAGTAPRWRTVGLISLTLATVVSLPWRNAGYYFSSWETLAGYWTRIENLNDGTHGKYLPLVAAVEQSTPADAKLLLLFEHRGLYLRRAREIGTPGFRAGGVPRNCESDSRQFRDWLTNKHITHLVLARTPAGPDQTPEWQRNVEYVYRAVERAAEDNVLAVAWESETHVLFRVN